MLQRANAIFIALLMVTYMCFPVFSVFAKDAEADTPAMSGVRAATDATTATDGTTDGSQDKDVVASFEQLRTWVVSNNRSGKTVTFSKTITIPNLESVWIRGVTLDTANHGLVISGTIRLDGVTIIGKSTENPVVTIAKGGSLYIDAKQSEITSDGTAVKIEKGDIIKASGIFEVLDTGWCEIRADAVGIVAKDKLKLSNTSIISDGTGILSSSDVDLFLCDIKATNPIETTGTVILDNCLVNKQIDKATVKSSDIIDISGKKYLRQTLPLGKALPPNLFDAKPTVTFENDADRAIPVSWNISAINTSKAGKYEVKGTILVPYDRFHLDDKYPLTAWVEIVDASLPVLYNTTLAGLTYTFHFLYDAENLSSLTLWRWNDDSEEWYDYTEDATMYFGYPFDDGILMLTFGRDEVHPIQLVFEVEGLGESQILHITWDDYGGARTNIGGDRTGGDRGENKLPGTTTPTEPPPDTTTPTEPPPDTTPPLPSTTSRERTSTTYDRSYESAEKADSDETSEPVIDSELPEIITGSEQPTLPTATRASSPLQSPSQPYTEAAADKPEAPDTATPNAEAEHFEAVQTAAIQEIANVPIEEPIDYTENTQGSKPLSDTVIPIVAISTVGLLGAGTYLGVAGKLSLHSLIKMLAGWLRI